jgi:type VI protein secretion system component VasA
MSKKSIVSFFVTILTVFGLTACSKDEPVHEKVVTVPVPTLTAEQKVMQDTKGVQQVAKQVARASKFRHTSACNSTPVQLAESSSFKNLPITGASIYKETCKAEIIAMKVEMKAFAKQEADRKKLAATKHAKQKAAAKKVDKKHS